jgi:hypothetical protein
MLELFLIFIAIIFIDVVAISIDIACDTAKNRRIDEQELK